MSHILMIRYDEGFKELAEIMSASTAPVSQLGVIGRNVSAWIIAQLAGSASKVESLLLDFEYDNSNVSLFCWVSTT